MTQVDNYVTGFCAVVREEEMGWVCHHYDFCCIPIDLTRLLKESVTKTLLDSSSKCQVITEIHTAKQVQEKT